MVLHGVMKERLLIVLTMVQKNVILVVNMERRGIEVKNI